FGGLGRAGLGAVPEHDVGLDDRAALRVGRGDHAGLHHVGVPEQRLLHLGPGDVVPGRDDHVVAARLVPVVTVGVPEVGVAGQVPPVPHVGALALVGEVPAA